MPSVGGTFVQPSETLCTHICGLQVAVMVGLEGDPLGRNNQGLPVSVVGVTVEVVGIIEVTAGVGVKVMLPVVTVGAPSGSSDITNWFCPFIEAKKCLANSRASSWLASLVVRVILGISICPTVHQNLFLELSLQRYRESPPLGLT